MVRRNADMISREELRNAIGKEKADEIFGVKTHYMLLGRTRKPTKDDIETARRFWSGDSPEGARDFATANNLMRWHLAALTPDRKRHLRLLDVMDELIQAGEPITLDTLAAKFKGTHIRNSSVAALAARRSNITKAREARAKKVGRK